MIVPVALAAGAAALFIAHRRRASSDADTSRETHTTDEAGGDVDGWNAAWGTPNEWDRRYPAADHTRPVPFRWEDLDPALKTKLETAFAAMQARGLDPYVYEGGRSQKRQAYLYGLGRPEFPVFGRSGNRVTWVLSASNHGKYPCRAVDVISRRTAWNDPAFFVAWGEEAKRAGLKWGGDWKVRDMPHVELP